MDLAEGSSSQPVVRAPSLLLRTPKRDCRKGEKIVVIVTLANFTQQPLVVNKRLRMIPDYRYREAYELWFHVIGPENTPIAPIKVMENWRQLYITPEDFVELAAGGQWQQNVTLSSCFDLSQRGVYQIVAEYHNDYDGRQFDLDAWTGELRSLPLEVVIGE